MGFLLLATLVPLGVFYQAVQQLPLSRDDQDYQAALTAAEGGVDDYINRLDQNQNYWQYTTSSPDPTNPAFTGWTNLTGGPSSAVGNTTQFRYSPDASQRAQTGIIYLTSSGRANNRIRTIKVGLRLESPLDYLYYTNYETVDPNAYWNPLTAQRRCVYHAYDYNPTTGGYGPDPSYCSLIEFVSADTLNGPVHTDDEYYICGNPTFNGPADSADPTAPRWIDEGCGSAPNFAPGNPAYKTAVPVPSNNTYIENQTAVGASGGGCLYTGPTTITFNSNGTYSVNSPETKYTNLNCLGNSSSYTIGTNPGTVTVTTSNVTNWNGVIYVQSVPSSSTDPNYTANCATISNPIRTWGTDKHSGCSGDAIVSGTVSGQFTVAGDNDVNIDGNVCYAGNACTATTFAGNALIGLSANNYVEINDPTGVRTCGASGASPPPRCDQSNPIVDAAILALNHSFIVMNYSTIPVLGTLTVNGAIEQKFRGPVGTHSGTTIVSGYGKGYTYDNRLKYLSPPFLIDTTQVAPWERVSFAELTPCTTTGC